MNNGIDNGIDLMSNIAAKTDSELILFSIILTVVFLGYLVSSYHSNKARALYEETARRQEIEWEGRIIEVISANTEVMYSLKTTLENMGVSMNISFQLIHDRLDQIITVELKEIRQVVNYWDNHARGE